MTFQIDNICLNYQKEGLGSIHFGAISVVAMGPHFFPMGEISRFGICRKSDDFSDIVCTENKVSGWTRLLSVDAWIYFVAEKQGDKVRLKALFENTLGEEPFAFVFFVKAKEVEIEKKRYEKGGLNRFQGMSSLISFIHEKERVQLISEKGPLQIIPLAGGEHFWGADFLVAFEGCERSLQKVFDFEKILFYDVQ